MDDNLFNEALIFAQNAHKGVSRKSSNIPFILHPMEVACIASSISERQELLAAALLHDTVEDADVSLEEIKEKFGEKVAYLVETETEDKRRHLLPEDSWMIRKEESLEVLKNSDDLDVKILWLADKLSNIRSFYRLYLKKGDDLWNNFHQKDKNKQAWYYKKVYEYTSELKSSQAYEEYGVLLNKIFGGTND